MKNPDYIFMLQINMLELFYRYVLELSKCLSAVFQNTIMKIQKVLFKKYKLKNSC
jgi:hypothetical protein